MKHTPEPWFADCDYIGAECELDENGMMQGEPDSYIVVSTGHRNINADIPRIVKCERLRGC